MTYSLGLEGRGVIAEHYPRARYTGIELSEYLCRELGWTQASIADYRGRGSFDLVICCEVLEHLRGRGPAAPIEDVHDLPFAAGEGGVRGRGHRHSKV